MPRVLIVTPYIFSFISRPPQFVISKLSWEHSRGTKRSKGFCVMIEQIHTQTEIKLYIKRFVWGQLWLKIWFHPSSHWLLFSSLLCSPSINSILFPHHILVKPSPIPPYPPPRSRPLSVSIQFYVSNNNIFLILFNFSVSILNLRCWQLLSGQNKVSSLDLFDQFQTILIP